MIHPNTSMVLLSAGNWKQELHTILTFATHLKVLGIWKDFRSKFVKPIEAARQRTATEYALKHGSQILKDLQEMIKPSVLMRKRKDYLGDIVPRNIEWDCWCALSPEQRKLYNAYLQSDDSNVQEIALGNQKCVLPVITKLRMICGHPLLQSRNKNDVLRRCQEQGAEKVTNMSPKLKLLVNIVTKSCDQGRRVLVFTHFIDMLDIVEFVLSSTDDLNVCRIDGKTSAKPKQLEAIVNDFNSDASLFNVMVVSIKAGGEGLTLTGASVCIVYDPVWSQAESDQAVVRICRPGQTLECESFYLIAAGTVEEKVCRIGVAYLAEM
jgi:SNF2 family DNA or RNA helicase